MTGAWTPAKVDAFKTAFFNFLKVVRINSKEKGGNYCLADGVYEAQRRFLDGVFGGLAEDKHDFSVLKSRQLGISTISRALVVFYLGVTDGIQGAAVMDTDVHKEEYREEIESIIDNLPKSVKFPRIKKRNRNMITLENGSVLRLLSAGVRSSKSGGVLGRSSGINLVHGSEMCSWENDEGVTALKNALAEDFADRLYLWESTARGFNRWHTMWEEAKADELNKVAIFIGWWAKDNQRLKRGTPAFEKYGTAPITMKEQERIDEVRERYGFEVDIEQLAWYRRKTDPTLAKEDGDEEDQFAQQDQPWCVVAGTRVGTDNGILKITDVEVGMRTARGRVLASMPTGQAKIWLAKTKLGYEIEGTGNHPLIRTDNSEIEIGGSLGAMVRLQAPKFADHIYTHKWKTGIVDSSVTITPDLARLVGIFMGDGSMYGSPRSGYQLSIACTGKDRDVADECHRLIRDLFGVATQEKVIPGKDGGEITVKVTSKNIYETFMAMGLLRHDTVKTMRRVHVPEFIFRSPKYVVKEFLRGLFETDGFNDAKANRCALFSKWPEFLRDVQILLLGFGITSRRAETMKIGGTNRHTYRGCQLELRASEAKKFNDEIGFLSARKIARSIKAPQKKKKTLRPITFEDQIISVEQTGRTEDVFNLTVEGEHWFDANGILTHNTEDEAFVMSGSSFFSSEKLTERAKEAAKDKYTGYRFFPGDDFVSCDFQRARSAKDSQLKIWEEPDPNGVYVVAADPAYGHDEKNDRSACQVLRCYADCIEQVAEFASASTPTNQFAWLIASLVGYYKNIGSLIIEINGPGEAVWNEYKGLRQLITQGYLRGPAQERGLRDIFNNVRNYFFTRSDSLSMSNSLMWKTTTQLKVAIMERERDFTNNGQLRIRSLETIEEMRSVTRDGDVIKAEGRKKDDRVITIALGIRAWEERVRKAQITGGQTKVADLARRAASPQSRAALLNKYQMDTFFRQKERARVQAKIQARRARYR